MNRIVTFALPTFFLLAHATFAHDAAPTLPVDSIGVVRKDGRRFVLHRVDQGQTLYAVGRRYGVPVDAIRAANPDLNDNLRYDQLLRVPVSDPLLARQVQAEVEKIAKKKESDKLATIEMDATVRTATKSQAKSEKTSRSSAASTKGTHLVEDGQTLYGLAARYQVSMADLRRWNDLGAKGIQPGMTLIVSEQAYEAKNDNNSSVTASVVSDKPTPVKPAPQKSVSAKSTESVSVASTPTRATEPEPVTASVVKEKRSVDSESAKPATKADDSSVTASIPKERPNPVRSTPSKSTAGNTTEPVKLEVKPIITPDPLPTPGSKPKPKPTESKPEEKADEPKPAAPSRADDEPATTVRKANVRSEIGFADLIEGNNSSAKYLALHRSAPTGTLVQVRNDITNQSLYVKVIGKLPDTGLNNQVLIRLSGRAFEKLSPNGQRFRAEVSYSN